MKKHHKKKSEQGDTDIPVDPAVDSDAESQPAAEVDQAASLRDQLQRLAADYHNYQKRSARQVDQAREFAIEEILKSLLAVLDNFQHTLDKGHQVADVASLMAGVTILFDHLKTVLEQIGMQRIEVTPGDPFDPTLHEAMLYQESPDYPPQSVLSELAAGYTIHGRTLRPAKVAVVKAPAPEGNPAEATESEDTEPEGPEGPEGTEPESREN